VPIYQAIVRMRDELQAIDQEYSFNGHVTTAGTSDDAWELANQIGEALAGTVLPDTVTVYSVSVRNPDVINGFQTRLVNIPGTRVATGATLPNWNTVKLQGQVNSGARPVTWHLRCGLTEDDVSGQNLSAGMAAALLALIGAFTILTGFCDKYGAAFVSFTPDELIRNRQQGWRRRTRPGYKRGWVPV